MAMKRCPVCGEKYSDTYKNCPFCEEDELWEEEEPRRPVKGRRTPSHGSQYSLITPTLIVLILLMAALLVYLLYGERIAQRFAKDPDSSSGNDIIAVEPTPGVSSGDDENPDGGDAPGEDTDGEDTGATGNAGVMPEETDSGSQGDSGSTGTASGTSGSDYATLSRLPSGLTLSNPDFTRSVGEGAYRLRVSGGSGTYTWVSENPSIATVDSNGNVTPVAAGTVHILVTDGSKQAVGVVRVSGGSTTASNGGNSSSGGTATGSGGANTLNREDMTISVGETFKLQLSGITTSLTWSVANSGIATVSGDGTVTGVSAGMTTVTVSWDGNSKSCIVRVK